MKKNALLISLILFVSNTYCQRNVLLTTNCGTFNSTEILDSCKYATSIVIGYFTDYDKNSTKHITKFPEELFELSNLEEIEIYNTAIEHIPKEIVKLKHLKRITIMNSRLKEIPSYLSLLDSLEMILIRNGNVLKIASEIGTMPSLKDLAVSGNPSLNDDSLFVIIKNSNIRGLTIGNLKTRTLPNSILEMKHLQYLIVENSQKLNYDSLILQINGMQNLKRLEFIGCRINERDVVFFQVIKPGIDIVFLEYKGYRKAPILIKSLLLGKNRVFDRTIPEAEEYKKRTIAY